MLLDAVFLLPALLQPPAMDLGKCAAVVLERLHPDAGEATSMLAALLAGEAMDPDKGWWRRSASVRGWEWLQAWSDADGDQRVGAGELGHAPEILRRLDRDDDGFVTALDFAPGGGEVSGSVAAVFQRLDADRNDEVELAEIVQAFQAADRRRRGYVSRQDLAALLPELAGGGGAGRPPGRMPGRWGFLYLFLNGQLGHFQPGPALGDPAPDFELRELSTQRSVRLRDAWRQAPVVLLFGSFT